MAAHLLSKTGKASGPADLGADHVVIGTTDIAHSGKPEEIAVAEEEVAYLCRAANRRFDLGLAARLEVRGHLRDVLFESVEVEKEGWSWNVPSELHSRRC